MIAVDCRTRRLLHSRSVGTKPSVRFVTRACEGHLKQYEIRYNNVERLFYSVRSPARVTNRTVQQLPQKRTVVGSLRQGRAEAEHPRAVGNIRELASIRLRRAGSPVVTNQSQDAQAQSVSAALVAVIAGEPSSLP